MILFAKQKQRHREQTFDYREGKAGVDESGDWYIYMHYCYRWLSW